MLLLHEWPLVLFTLLLQSAVGIVLVGECLLRRAEDERLVTCLRRQSCAAFILFAVGGLLSLLHTGSPLNSFHTLSNIGSSWLSREIAVLSFTGLVLLWLAFMRRKERPQTAEKTVARIAIVAGLILVAIMSRVYRLAVVPAWNSHAGLLAFFASVLLCGALWHGFMLNRLCQGGISFSGLPQERSAARLLFAAAFLGFLLAAASLPLSVSVQEAGLNMRTALIPFSCLAWSLTLRIALTGTAVLLFCIALLREDCKRFPVGMAGMALLLLAVGEFFGRALFYLSYVRVGM